MSWARFRSPDKFARRRYRFVPQGNGNYIENTGRKFQMLAVFNNGNSESISMKGGMASEQPSI